MGVSSEITSKSYVAGLGGQTKPALQNTPSYNEAIKKGVEKIQALIGYGNSNISDITSYLNIFGGNPSDSTTRKIDTSALTAITQYQNQLNELNLNQYSPAKATTGSGAILKPVIEYVYKGDVMPKEEGGGTGGKGIVPTKNNLGIGKTTKYPRLENGNTLSLSKILTTTSPTSAGGKGASAAPAKPPELLNASIHEVTVKSGGNGYNKNIPPTIIFLNNPVPKDLLAGIGTEVLSANFRRARGDAMIDDAGHFIGVHMTDRGSGYVTGTTIVVDTAHPKTASGENMKISLTGSVVTNTGSHYNPATDSISIRYQGEDGKIKDLTATASSIEPVGISSSPNELVKVQTVIGKDGSIQQIKKVENFNNLTLKNIIAYHKPDNIITTATYETSYLTGITRLVGIVTALAPFDNSPLLQEQEKVKNSSNIASIRDSSGVRATFNFDNAAIIQVLYGPGGQMLKVDFNKYLEGLAGMPEFTVRSPSGTGMQLELQLSFDIVSADKQDSLNDQKIETIDGQLYVDGEPIFGQVGIVTVVDCVGKN